MSYSDLLDDYFGSTLQLVIDLIYLADVFINFNTGLYHLGTIVLRKAKIARIYLKSW